MPAGSMMVISICVTDVNLLFSFSPGMAFTELQATYSIVGGTGLRGRPNGNYITWLGSWNFNGRSDAVFDHYVEENGFVYQDNFHIVTQIALVRNRAPKLFDVDAKVWPLSVSYDGTWENEIFHDGNKIKIMSEDVTDPTNFSRLQPVRIGSSGDLLPLS